jgi:hypothetical protein
MNQQQSPDGTLASPLLPYWFDYVPENVVASIVANCFSSTCDMLHLMQVNKRLYTSVTSTLTHLEFPPGWIKQLQVVSACRFPNLVELVLQGGSNGITDTELFAILSACRNLRVLVIEDSTISDVSLGHISHCSYLKRLSLARSRNITDEVREIS